MGIVLRQSFKNTISTYLGFGIGAINTLFLYTNFLTDNYYGLVAFLLSAANIMMPFMAFGVHNAIIKFYSSFKSKTSINSFLTLMLFLPFVFIIPIALIGYSSYDAIGALLSNENKIAEHYVWHIFVLAIAMAYFEIFFAWSKVQLQTVFGNLMKEVFHRVCIMILLFAVYFEWLTVNQFILALVGVYVVRMLIMMLYAFSIRFPKLKFQKVSQLSSILNYAGLMIIAGSVAMLILDIDKFMIGLMLENIEQVAYYSVAIFIATVIAVPQRAMHQIMMPLTAQYLNDNDNEALEDLYKRSSLSLLVISGFIFLLIILNINQLYEILPKEFTGGLFVVLIVSLAKLYDNSLGNNNAILFNSNYYKIVLLFGVLLAIMAIILNVVFIPVYGIEGSAFATFLAVFIYNTTKVLFIKQKFKMQPFSQASLKVILVIICIAITFYFWELPFHSIINIILKSILIGVFYIISIYKLNISEDISGQIKKYLRLK
ncbi:polysaccharide biosynthesis C-terminal domain-containing protein [Winogradskyella flava]|uniref:Polysaccharide biosynthesis C-terminal domain-containing protein n=1 Tax=Winogradskyella flava TaxID=1884876 RepID=A0A842INX7_9FLAO|nr:polysaccharide biosynthesis C-terminal domain-containing protein [Winogradskyella flava]MBC2844932.1 polysaccharide biosynthesis C-terminal domain-containing protein [Winogradskyella flava]